MTKSMPMGCIKVEKFVPSWKHFNILTEKVCIEDEIAHLFVTDIHFGEKNATERQMMYNELHTLAFEKEKCLIQARGLLFNF